MTSLVDSATIPAVTPLADSVAPKKRGWLPLLTVLFLISYGIMTMLIVEQGETIESQRALIRELFRDSSELNAVKMQMNKDNAAKNHSQAPAAKAPQNPVNNPSTQAPTRQAPSSQAVPQQRAQKQMQKPQFQMPSKPASDLADQERSLITI